MAELLIQRDQLVLRLLWWERVIAVHRNVRVPLSAVRSVSVVADPAYALKRRFRPAFAGTDLLAAPYGVRHVWGIGRGFIAVRRHRPALHITLDAPSRFAELLVSVPEPDSTAADIRSAAGLC